MGSLRRVRLAGVAGLLAIAGCDDIGRIPASVFDSRTPRERYEAGLAQAGLATTALALDWTSAARRAMDEAPLVATPHAEEGIFDPSVPVAFAYRFTAQRGQDVVVAMDWRGAAPGLVFLEAWRAANDSTRAPARRIAVADSGASQLTFEPRQSGDYVVLVQPELLRGGRFRISLRVGPSLSFPVHGGTNPDIGSLFGAPRDGGARRHRGIDIFARRRTPALATGEATVTRVGDDRLGGLVVWLRDRRGNSLYYAHLDSQMVREGQQVRAGDTIGLVGKTGNARTTPPHLHFQVYRRGEGSVDPYWFVARTTGLLPPLRADTTILGSLAFTRRPTVLLESPVARAAPRDTLARRDTVQVIGAVGSWYRVLRPGGTSGYLPVTMLEVSRADSLSPRVALGPAPLQAQR